MNREKGFLRLTLVLSILSAITTFIYAAYFNNYFSPSIIFAFVWFIAIWIAYAVARWIILPIIKWIIAGFGEDEIKKFFTNTGKLRMFVYVCVGILSIILSVCFFSSIITKLTITTKHHTRRLERQKPTKRRTYKNKALEARRKALKARRKAFLKKRR